MNKNQQRELTALIGKYSQTDGLNGTAIAPLQYFKMSAPSARIPVVYNASLCLVVQGEKEVMLEDETYRYAASEFLVVSIDLPATGHVTLATPEKPYLCLQVDIDPKQLSDLVTETVRTEVHGAPTQRALFVGSTNDQLTDALLRLASLLEARRLLLVEGTDAASAAYRVGYESASQFSREYSRMFGAPPISDVTNLRENQRLTAS